MNVAGNEFALLKKADGKILFGEGPFTEVEACPKSGVAFYVNDFALTDAKPWKIPYSVREIDSVSAGEGEALEVEWEELNPGEFAKVFSEINQAIGKGEIEKSVPVAAERGKVVSGGVGSLLDSLNTQEEAFFPYAWVKGDAGFCGLTPEVLFNFRKGRLNTMALAGTAMAGEQEVFAFDEKEIREHEFVAQTLVSKLSDIGMVTKSERSILDLGSLVHFHTPIEVFLYGDKNIDDLIRRLHPTPALGPLPRTQETMEDLIRWREMLDCPAYFGAPFGVLEDGVFHAVVTIRGVHWEGDEICVPSGCGVIEASRLVNEWRELGLKREAVKRSFGI
ncbi:MAG: chorismate-binding protein [Akkermansiaceae bacterium]